MNKTYRFKGIYYFIVFYIHRAILTQTNEKIKSDRKKNAIF
jgi:hypothetical protein